MNQRRDASLGHLVQQPVLAQHLREAQVVQVRATGLVEAVQVDAAVQLVDSNRGPAEHEGPLADHRGHVLAHQVPLGVLHVVEAGAQVVPRPLLPPLSQQLVESLLLREVQV